MFRSTQDRSLHCLFTWCLVHNSSTLYKIAYIIYYWYYLYQYNTIYQAMYYIMTTQIWGWIYVHLLKQSVSCFQNELRFLIFYSFNFNIISSKLVHVGNNCWLLDVEENKWSSHTAEKQQHCVIQVHYNAYKFTILYTKIAGLYNWHRENLEE